MGIYPVNAAQTNVCTAKMHPFDDRASHTCPCHCIAGLSTAVPSHITFRLIYRDASYDEWLGPRVIDVGNALEGQK